MTGLLTPGLVVQATTIALEHEPLPPDQVVAGAPTTGFAVLVEGSVAGGGSEIGGSAIGGSAIDGSAIDGPAIEKPEIGVWEMTPGTGTDVEVDEVFVVLAGRATLLMPGLDAVELTPGSVVQLAAGMVTTWTVHETLRKLYVA